MPGTGVRIGKEGLKQGVIDEIRKQLKLKGLVKVKLLRNFILSNANKSKKELFLEISQKTGGEIIKSAGFVLILRRPGFCMRTESKIDFLSRPKRFINKQTKKIEKKRKNGMVYRTSAGAPQSGIQGK